ncbi:pseudouridine synthase [Microstroma glucosiphilum]|uniref:tRNA pseudouridine(55) synthase n=1 Tax=Pseudomicrostroma glucosiphilum TaxID=1684307 RepID=A0A316UFM6_9BASI|nr:pseudouridine synthase [Pseudomicrostroma glucosiphilum]PWN24127.1 pseudouridine synthase [Pseudomicrostroma glucosiphilum]
MPDLSGAPPTLGSKAKLQSQRGGAGRFNPSERGGNGNGRGRGGGHSRGGGRGGYQGSSEGGSGNRNGRGPTATNPQHPGHIPGSLASRPLNGVFAIDKPSGKTCMELLDSLKDLLAYSPLFRNPDGTLPEGNGGNAWRPAGGKKNLKGKAAPPKIGQGGTLDPLASGVLVIGLGSGTKQLQKYLDCAKTYETTGLLGTATTSYDSQDPVMTRAPHSHVTEEMVHSLVPYFTGPLLQYPPIYSAVKMDGKRLFDYARQGLELPRPIEAREIEIVHMECYDWLKGGEHPFVAPQKEVTAEEKALLGRVKEIVDKSTGGSSTTATGPRPGGGSAPATSSSSTVAPAEAEAEASTAPPATLGEVSSSTPPDPESHLPAAAFKLRMTVSSGTYVRTIVHDVGQACNSAAHVVELRRVRQGEWGVPLAPNPVRSTEEAVKAEQVGQEGSLEEGASAATSAAPASKTTTTEEPPSSALVLEDMLGEAEGSSSADQPMEAPPAEAEAAAELAAAAADPEPLPCLPWSLFLSALEEQSKESDPNARNFRRKVAGGGKVEGVEGKQDQDIEEKTEGEVEPVGGVQEEGPELRQWEKELLRVLQPC